MKPTKFEEANKCLTKPQNMTDDECMSLWVHSDGRQCLSLWKMSFKERLQALLFGKVWLYVASGTTQPPVWVSVENNPFEE